MIQETSILNPNEVKIVNNTTRERILSIMKQQNEENEKNHKKDILWQTEEKFKSLFEELGYKYFSITKNILKTFNLEEISELDRMILKKAKKYHKLQTLFIWLFLRKSSPCDLGGFPYAIQYVASRQYLERNTDNFPDNIYKKILGWLNE